MDFFISRAGADAEEALWIAKELRAAGYTTWLQDEDFRIDTSIIENITIGTECRYTIAVMSPEYFGSKYTKQEWQAAHYGEKLIQVMHRSCNRPGLILPFSHITFDGKNAEQKRKVLLDALRPLIQPKLPQQIAIAKVIKVAHPLIGRDQQLCILDRAWSNGKTRIVSIVAGGGVGKTSLAVEWWRRNQAQGATRVLGWSFYLQGAGEGRQASAENFFDRAFRQWFGEENPPKDSWERGERLAELIRSERALLILDGVEPIQQPDGSFKDPGMTSLLAALSADANPGMCICTSRLPLTDLDTYVSGEVLKINLENLSEADGTQYLRLLEVPLTDDDLHSTSREFGNHALALTLLGRYLANRESRGRNLDEIPPLFAEPENGGHARRVMRHYEQVFKDKPELAVLRLLGLFDRPADPGAIGVIREMPFFAMPYADWNSALKNLYDARLVYEIAKDERLDCHPLIREHFASELEQFCTNTFTEAHSCLYQHYSKQAPYQPDTLVQMTPLFYAVYHGCKAGRHQETFENIYFPRMLRNESAPVLHNRGFLWRNLGALGLNLSMLSEFFRFPWTNLVSDLTPSAEFGVVDNTAFSLRALARYEEAADLFAVGAHTEEMRGNWRNAGVLTNNLSELELVRGNIAQAIRQAKQALTSVDKSEDHYQRLRARATLANCLCQAGNRNDEVAALFNEAEVIQSQRDPDLPQLYSVQGYRFCDFLLATDNAGLVLRRAETLLQIAKVKGWLLAIGLAHLVVSCLQSDSSARNGQVESAVQALRSANQADYLPLGLLARAASLRLIGDFAHAQRHLDEVRIRVKRCGMRLYLTDYHLEQARLFRASSKPECARPHIAHARELIAETGYHRRDAELADLE